MQKRILPLALALMLSLGLAACRSQDGGAVTISPVSLYNASTKQTVSLGMSRQEVEALLGQGTFLSRDAAGTAKDSSAEETAAEPSPYTDYSYGGDKDTLYVTYTDDKATGVYTHSYLANDHAGDSNWMVTGNLTYGSTKEEMSKQFSQGDPTFSGQDPSGADIDVYVFYFDDQGNALEQAEGAASLIQISVSAGQGTVQSVGTYTANQESATK